MSTAGHVFSPHFPTERRLIQLPFLAYPSGPIDAGKLH